MAWNEPENNDRDKNGWNNEPGGKKDKDQGPPDLDEALSALVKKLNGMFSGKGGSNRGTNSDSGSGKNDSGIFNGLTLGLLVILGLLWVGMGFYTVDEQERGVVLRFGRALESVVPPGLHWNPWLIDEVTKINVTLVRSETFSNSMLTEDDNIVDVTMSVQYQATDARAYFLNVRDPIISLQHAAESSIRHEVGSSKMQAAMTDAREPIAQAVLQRLQSYIDLYGTGITVNQVNIDRSQPPESVRAAYDDVIKAGEDREAYQNEATAYANQVVPEARGLARRVVEEANAYRDQVVARSEGEASRFEQLLVEYQKAPGVTRERLYLDTLQEVMSRSSKVLVDVEGGNNMLYLPLDKIMEGRSAPDVSGRIGGLTSEELRQLSDQLLRDQQTRQNSSTITRGATR